MSLSFINGYVPAAGTSVTVLDAAGVTGAFKKVVLTGVTGLKAVQHVSATAATVTFEAS